MLAADVPLYEFRGVADVNHYTIVMADAGRPRWLEASGVPH